MNKQELGSQTAKNGFKNEDYVVSEFNIWRESGVARDWLTSMNYSLDAIDEVRATKISGHKADVQVVVTLQTPTGPVIEHHNVQVKLVSNPKGFNQIDKRWLDHYHKLWNIPTNILLLLKRFTGEVRPTVSHSRDVRRMFADEFTLAEQADLVEFFVQHQALIVSDILQGRGEFAADWMMVILRLDGATKPVWVLKPMDVVINQFGKGPVIITARGSIKIGSITVQRKGGDAGRDTANMLQFKINPAELIEGGSGW